MHIAHTSVLIQDTEIPTFCLQEYSANANVLLKCGFANDSALAGCRINPSGELRFDGTTLHPYDAMFVKMKRTMIQAEAPAARNVMRYQQWMSMAVSGMHFHSDCSIC